MNRTEDILYRAMDDNVKVIYDGVHYWLMIGTFAAAMDKDSHEIITRYNEVLGVLNVYRFKSESRPTYRPRVELNNLEWGSL